MKTLKNITALSLVAVICFLHSDCGDTFTYDFPNPKVSAAPDTTIILPDDMVTLRGSFSFGGGTANAIITWTQTYGTPAQIDNPRSLTTKVRGLTTPGDRGFQLSVSVTEGVNNSQIGYASVTIKVLSASANKPPLANAGPPDTTIALPLTEITLKGTGTDPERGGVKYLWTQLPGGPVTGDIKTKTEAETLITGLTVAGSYVFRLTVTDGLGATGTDDITVMVNEAADTNTFKTSSTENLVAASFRLPGELIFNGSPPIQNTLHFFFLNDASLPGIGHTLRYKVSFFAFANDEVRVKAEYQKTGGSSLTYFASGTDSVVAKVENRNGFFYVTLPETLTEVNFGTDTILVSANVHEF